MSTSASDRQGGGALDGLKVLDLSFYAPGRVASLMLADLGADVVCVEMPPQLRPSESRLDDDTSSRWMLYQRNKRSVTLDLKSPEGHEVFERLVRGVDVVIESYKPGTATRLGVDYDAARAINPSLVYCSVSGFGQTGPYSQVIGHEPNYQGLGGALGQNRMEGRFPGVLPALVGDMVGGAYNGVMAILAALWKRDRTGQGQWIDVSIAAGIVSLLGSLPHAQWLGEEYRAQSFATGHRANFRAYRTKDDRYVAISPGTPWLWERFCRAIEREDLIERKAWDADGAELVAILADVFATKTRDEWESLNQRENVSVTPVLTDIYEISDHPQTVHRGFIVDVDYEPLGTVKQILPGFTMSETPPTVRWIPRYGEHSSEVLSELGYSDLEIEELRRTGVTG